MVTRILLAVLWIFAVASSPVCAETQDITKSTAKNALKVLFIGNSLTFFNSLPNTVATFIEAGAKRQTSVSNVVVPGATLKQHWDQGDAQKKIGTGSNWDYVAIQGKSMESYENRAGFFDYGKRLADAVRKAHAEPILYETFANLNKPQNQALVHDSYFALGKELHSKVIPVGDAFYFVRKNEPSIELWLEDKLHPTPAGTYLAGCVFYEFLTGKSPVGLPAVIPSHNIKGQGYSISDGAAQRLQEQAWRFYCSKPTER